MSFDNFDRNFDRHMDRVDNMLDNPQKTVFKVGLAAVLINLVFWLALIAGILFLVKLFF